jgi:ferredoxin-NADP reductase
VARAAVPGRLTWRAVTIAATRQETASARTLVLDVPGWPGHLPGQHLVARLTAEDGYSSQRDYSIASAPASAAAGAAASAPASAADRDRVELTIQRADDGEVSGYLAGMARPGDRFDIRGPIGQWFVWHPDDPRPLLLLAGGSGVVPLMSMVRTHQQVKSEAPVRLIYSARTPADVIYAPELSERSRVSQLGLTYAFTRAAPDGMKTGRIDAALIAKAAFPPEDGPAIFVCGPSGFVEAASSLLVRAGHDFARIKTERFG